MASTSLSQSADHIEQMWDDSNYNFQSNISLMNSLNLVGYKPALPNNSYATTEFYELHALEGFCQGLYTAREQHECKRTLQESLSGESTMANTYVIMYASNYTIRAFSNTGTTTVTNTTTGTGTGAGTGS